MDFGYNRCFYRIQKSTVTKFYCIWHIAALLVTMTNISTVFHYCLLEMQAMSTNNISPQKRSVPWHPDLAKTCPTYPKVSLFAYLGTAWNNFSKQRWQVVELCHKDIHIQKTYTPYAVVLLTRAVQCCLVMYSGGWSEPSQLHSAKTPD